MEFSHVTNLQNTTEWSEDKDKRSGIKNKYCTEVKLGLLLQVTEICNMHIRINSCKTK
jgi:hypothetical protein